MDIYLARQPIFTPNNNTYAYELLFRNNAVVNQYEGLDGDGSTADVIIGAFFDLHTRDILKDKKAFINFTANLIRRGTPKLLPAENVVIEILENIIPDEEIIERIVELKELGYTIALDDFVFSSNLKELFMLGDIIKVDFQTEKSLLEKTVQVCIRNKKIILAEKVETHADFEYAQKIGASLIQGYYYAKPTIVTKKTVSPMTRSFIQILSLLNEPDPDVDEIIETISTDAALVMKLLRLVNSVYYGAQSKISTIQQAIVMLGLEPLKEWIYLLSMNRMQNNKSDELLRLSLMRAKFCQEVTEKMPGGTPYSKEMYLMGLISLMNVFSEIPQEQMLDELPVSQIIKDGLTGKGGVFTAIYKLCRAYEAAKWDEVDVCAQKLGLDRSTISRIYVYCAEFVQKFWDNIK